MKLSTFKNHLNQSQELTFTLPNGEPIPSHFHITEVGLITKNFIDCGGTVRSTKIISFQVWVANDTEHRLEPQKLLKIISSADYLFENEDYEIEVEYDSLMSAENQHLLSHSGTWQTIGRYGIEFYNDHFIFTTKQTDCLAKDQCGVPPEKIKVKLSDIVAAPIQACTPGGNCC